MDFNDSEFVLRDLLHYLLEVTRNNEPECRYSNLDEWSRWSDEIWVCEEILKQLDNGYTADTAIAKVYCLMQHNQYVSELHSQRYNEMRALCIDIKEMLIKQEKSGGLTL